VPSCHTELLLVSSLPVYLSLRIWNPCLYAECSCLFYKTSKLFPLTRRGNVSRLIRPLSTSTASRSRLTPLDCRRSHSKPTSLPVVFSQRRGCPDRVADATIDRLVSVLEKAPTVSGSKQTWTAASSLQTFMGIPRRFRLPQLSRDRFRNRCKNVKVNSLKQGGKSSIVKLGRSEVYGTT
jgi:hypothetical protein